MADQQRKIQSEQIYEGYLRLFVHYSSRIFAARASTITATLLIAAYVFEVPQVVEASQAVEAPNGATARPTDTVCFLAAVLVGILWAIENGYFKKFNQIVIAARKLEGGDDPSFFKTYEPFTHISVYVYYLAAFLVYSIAWHQHTSSTGWFWGLQIFALFLLLASALAQTCSVATKWWKALKKESEKISRTVHVLSWVDRKVIRCFLRLPTEQSNGAHTVPTNPTTTGE